MDELIQNSLIMELHKRVGHGGYSCAEHFHHCVTAARFNCCVPYIACKITMNFIKSQELIVSISLPGSFMRYVYVDIYDPGFDPDKMLDDIVEVIKLLKKVATKKESLDRVINLITDKWIRLGRN